MCFQAKSSLIFPSAFNMEQFIIKLFFLEIHFRSEKIKTLFIRDIRLRDNRLNNPNIHHLFVQNHAVQNYLKLLNCSRWQPHTTNTQCCLSNILDKLQLGYNLACALLNSLQFCTCKFSLSLLLASKHVMREINFKCSDLNSD